MVGISFKITGDGAVHSIASASGNPQLQAKWWQITPESGNSAPLLIGGPEVTSTVGYPVPAGGSQFAPSISELSNRYNLAQQKYYLAIGDIADVLYGVD